MDIDDLKPGCYGDGALGHQHTREKCAEVLDVVREELTCEPVLADETEIDDLSRRLRAEMSDDAEEEHEAEQLLNTLWGWRNDNVLAYETWGWQDGDLGLWVGEVE